MEKQQALKMWVQQLELTLESPTAGIRHDMAWTPLSDTTSSLTTLDTTDPVPHDHHQGLYPFKTRQGFMHELQKFPTTPPLMQGVLHIRLSNLHG